MLPFYNSTLIIFYCLYFVKGEILMAQLKLKERPVEESEKTEQVEPEKHEYVNLGGSLASVTFLGLFIIVSWLGVWTLFMIR